MGTLFSNLIAVVFFGSFIAFGAMTFVSGWRSLQRSQEPVAWPQADGRIMNCLLRETEDDEDTQYEVLVTYTYQVAGRRYENDVLAFGYEASIDDRPHREILSKLKSAGKVAVRYDSGSPQNSVLSYGMHRSIRVKLAGGLLFIISAIAMAYIIFSGGGDAVLLRNLIVN